MAQRYKKNPEPPNLLQSFYKNITNLPPDSRRAEQSKIILLNENLAVSLQCKSNELTMKYNELHRKLRKFGCYPTGEYSSGHPLWYSPITGKEFRTSLHEAKEVAAGTLKSILRDAGIK